MNYVRKDAFVHFILTLPLFLVLLVVRPGVILYVFHIDFVKSKNNSQNALTAYQYHKHDKVITKFYYCQLL